MSRNDEILKVARAASEALETAATAFERLAAVLPNLDTLRLTIPESFEIQEDTRRLEEAGARMQTARVLMAARMGVKP